MDKSSFASEEAGKSSNFDKSNLGSSLTFGGATS
jgi:hypothetical protein